MLNILKKAYKNLRSQIGRPYLEKIFAEGFPEHLKSPLAFLLTQEKDSTTQEVIDKIESIRDAMAEKSDEFIEVYPSPELNSQQSNPMAVSLDRIAKVASINQYWGTFLYLIAHAQQAKTIFELGSCAGISGCYLAASPYCQKFITIEGSPSLAKIAESNLNQMSNNFVLFNTLFDSALDQILPNLTQTIDVAYIDGNHEKRATLNYLERLKPHLSQNGIVLFDDIHWTTDMEEAWQMIKQCQGFSYTIDLGRIGLGIWDSKTAHTKTYSLATYTDYWQRGKPKTYQNNLKS